MWCILPTETIYRHITFIMRLIVIDFINGYRSVARIKPLKSDIEW